MYATASFAITIAGKNTIAVADIFTGKIIEKTKRVGE